MPASDMFYTDLPDGTPHPATTGQMAPPTTRRAESSEMIDHPGSFEVPIDRPRRRTPEEMERDT